MQKPRSLRYNAAMSSSFTDSSGDGRVIMIMGEDADGDGHIFSTISAERAAARYVAMAATMTNVRVNEGFEQLVRPLVARPN